MVRAAGLALAMTTSIFAGRRFANTGFMNLNFLVFIASFTSLGTVVGAVVGIGLVEAFGSLGEALVRISLGFILIFIIFIMLTVKPKLVESSDVDKRAMRPGLLGEYREGDGVVRYRAKRLKPTGAALFLAGFIGGAFGLGAAGSWSPC